MTAHNAAAQDDPALGTWIPHAGSADSDLEGELGTITTRARDLVRNNPIASGAAATLKDNVIGHQMRLSAQPKGRLLGWDKDKASTWSNNTEDQFATWADSTECDAARSQTFLGLTLQAFTGAMINGDSFGLVMWLPRPDGRWSTRIQTIESDRVATPPWLMHDKTIRGGVKVDAFNAPVGYWIQKQHPGDNLLLHTASKDNWEYVTEFTPLGTRRVIHLFEKERSGQSRGKSIFTSVMREFKMLGEYLGYELQASMLNAMIARMIKTDMSPDSVAELFGDGMDDGSYYATASKSINQRSMKGTGGKFQVIPAGFVMDESAPVRPNAAFGEFVESIDRVIAAGLNIPYELLLKDFSKTNYSSARASLIEAWRFFHSKRRWLQDQWVNPIYEVWMEEAVDLDRVDAPDFYQNKFAYTACRWVFSGRGSIDPVKDAKAAELRLKMSHSTQQEECAELGKDYEDVQNQRGRELKQAFNVADELGLPEEAAYYLAGYSVAGVDSLATGEENLEPYYADSDEEPISKPDDKPSEAVSEDNDE